MRERRGAAAACTTGSALAALLTGCALGPARGAPAVDVCVYGASSAGVVAAVQLARLGRSVVLIDCDGNVGGMTTAGLGATDVGADAAIGGLAREFYRRLRQVYDDPASWRWRSPGDFSGRGLAAGSDVAWTFAPHAAAAVFAAMLAEVGVAASPARLDRGPGGVQRSGGRLLAIRTTDGSWHRARVFLDCSYEGDLLAAAGCAFTVGREANGAFGETLDGVQQAQAQKHQFGVRVDPWQRPGDPRSGLLPDIDGAAPAADGTADAAVQAYCYRLCTTDVAANRVPWPRPDDYDERDFELLLRWFDAGGDFAPWHPVALPDGKFDVNNNGPVSSDGIGRSWSWPTASYGERDCLAAAQRRWQQGLLWTLANHPRVPLRVRQQVAAHGLAADEFVATAHWPPQLYVREGRRLVGEFVVGERQCRGLELVPDPVGLGAYAMDSHNVRRHVVDGAVRNEGDVQVRVPAPYGIPFRALLPRRAECDNLLVPVAVSATHIAFGSIRMEPVFMVLAQSAAIAADLAVAGDLAVQDVDYAVLRAQLLRAGQVLAAPRPR